jgi:hypothetical protein
MPVARNTAALLAVSCCVRGELAPVLRQDTTQPDAGMTWQGPFLKKSQHDKQHLFGKLQREGKSQEIWKDDASVARIAAELRPWQLRVVGRRSVLLQQANLMGQRRSVTDGGEQGEDIAPGAIGQQGIGLRRRSRPRGLRRTSRHENGDDLGGNVGEVLGSQSLVVGAWSQLRHVG